MFKCIHCQQKKALFSFMSERKQEKSHRRGFCLYYMCSTLRGLNLEGYFYERKTSWGSYISLCNLFYLQTISSLASFNKMRNPITGCGWHPVRKYLRLDFCFHGCVSVTTQDFLILLLVSKTSRKMQLHNMGLSSVMCFISIRGILWAMWFWVCSK